MIRFFQSLIPKRLGRLGSVSKGQVKMHSDNSAAGPVERATLNRQGNGHRAHQLLLRNSGTALWPWERDRLTNGSKTHTVSVIVPTKNEAPSIEPLVSRLSSVLDRDTAEVIFADDSSDNTPEVIMKVAEEASIRIICVHRPPGERQGGLGGAVLAGLRVSTGEIAVVMDGDLQHPPECVPDLVRIMDEQGADVVLASRYSNGGHAGGLSNQSRRSISRAMTDVAKVLFPRRLAKVSDPMSGFFAVRCEAIELDRLRPMGFKIFLEILLRNRQLKVQEIGFTFAARYGGESKASVREGLRFFTHVFRLRVATLWRPHTGRPTEHVDRGAESTAEDRGTLEVAV
jgi:glycosyltransferase involved in cell wall biosynthesis